MDILSGLTVEHWFFYPLALLTLIGALGVVFFRNPLYGALSLVCSFFFLSGLYLLLGAPLVGILQIIVYAGAIMVLFLFVIMLLALSDKDLGRSRVTFFKILGGICALAVPAGLLTAFGLQKGSDNALVFNLGMVARPVGAAFGTVAAVGRSLFTEYPVQFEAVSLLLLVSIAGAVVVAKGRI